MSYLTDFLIRTNFISDLEKVLNNPVYKTISNTEKAYILLEMENEGEYDPEKHIG